jgi:hypothetical protein
MRRIRKHLTYANVMVTVLAFFILGGGSALAAFVVSSNGQIGPGTVAGHKPPKGDHANLITGSITTKDLAAGAIKAGKLGNGAVTNPKLADNSVSNAKLRIGAVGPAKLADGAVTGAKLANGAVGGSKIADGGVTANKIGLTSTTQTTGFDSNSPKSVSVQCPANTTVVGGSAIVDDGSGGDPGPVALSYDGLGLFLDGWHARAYETSATANSWQIIVTAICVSG